MINAPTYREAVEIARRYLDRRDIHRASESMLEMMAARLAIETGIAFVDEIGNRIDDSQIEFPEGNPPPPPDPVQTEMADQPTVKKMQMMFTGEHASEIDRLLSAAPSNPLAYDAAIMIAANMAMYGTAYPTPFGEWVAKILRGEEKRPAQKGRYPKVNKLARFLHCRGRD